MRGEILIPRCWCQEYEESHKQYRMWDLLILQQLVCLNNLRNKYAVRISQSYEIQVNMTSWHCTAFYSFIKQS